MNVFTLPHPNNTPLYSNAGNGLENRQYVKTFVHGLREVVQRKQQTAHDTYRADTIYTPMQDVTPYWMLLKQEQPKKKVFVMPPKEKKLSREQKKRREKIKDILVFVDANGLVYKELNPHPAHHRVINRQTGQFVDWWRTGTIKRANDTYAKIGRNNVSLLNELQELVSVRVS
jgi:hypothetical protein